MKIGENTCRITEETTKTLPTCNHETGNTRLTFGAAINNEVIDIAANVIVGKLIYLPCFTASVLGQLQIFPQSWFFHC